MFSSALFALVSLSLSVAAVEIQSSNSAFYNAGIQGCIAVADNADGEPLIIHNCNTENPANQDWDVTFDMRTPVGPQQIKIFGDKCIDVKDGVNADGTKLQIWSCVPGSKNQQWIAQPTENTFKWSGTDKCIDLSDGKITDGNVLQIWTCTDNSANQLWAGAPNPDTEQPGTQIASSKTLTPPYCIAAASATDGAEVALVECNNNADFHTTFPNGNITWTVPVSPLTGQIKTFNNKFCLDVPSGSTANGVKLQLWTCTPGNTNQLFRIGRGAGQIEWSGKGKCVDLTDGVLKNGNPIQMWDCAVPDNNPNQHWFY